MQMVQYQMLTLSNLHGEHTHPIDPWTNRQSVHQRTGSFSLPGTRENLFGQQLLLPSFSFAMALKRYPALSRMGLLEENKIGFIAALPLPTASSRHLGQYGREISSDLGRCGLAKSLSAW